MAMPRMEGLGRIALRGLSIAASSVSLVQLLRSEWVGGAAASAAWLLFVQADESSWSCRLCAITNRPIDLSAWPPCCSVPEV
jgi:hypothetical protein